MESIPPATRRRCVITGYGAITSMGQNVHDIWQAINKKILGYQYWDLSEYNIQAKFFGKMNKEPDIHSPRLQRSLSREGKLTLHAAAEAIQHAFSGHPISDSYQPERTGVILGSGWAGVDAAIDSGIQHHQKQLAQPFSNLMSMASGAATACAIQYQFQGLQHTLMAACAAGSMAIGQAYREIQNGTIDMALAGGVEAMRQPAALWSIDVLQALSKEQQDPRKACAPFSSGRSGFVLSEGAAVLVLESYETALRRGATILGEIVGYGYQCGAESFTGLGDVAIRARSISLALKEANLLNHQIGYINAHGTSTPDNDIHETRSIKLALGSAAYNVPISSTKSYTGHLIGAAGAIETIFCLKTLETGILPATLHLTDPDPHCDLNYLPNQHQFADVQHCLNLNSGFGGHHSTLVLRKITC